MQWVLPVPGAPWNSRPFCVESPARAGPIADRQTSARFARLRQGWFGQDHLVARAPVPVRARESGRVARLLVRCFERQHPAPVAAALGQAVLQRIEYAGPGTRLPGAPIEIRCRRGRSLRAAKHDAPRGRRPREQPQAVLQAARRFRRRRRRRPRTGQARPRRRPGRARAAAGSPALLRYSCWLPRKLSGMGGGPNRSSRACCSPPAAAADTFARSRASSVRLQRRKVAREPPEHVAA